jgi:hypothetical protein
MDKKHYCFVFYGKTYYTVMLYFTRFLIWNHIPPIGVKTKFFVSNTNGTGVFLLTANRYLDRRENNPTFFCISPNPIPEIKINFE